MSTGLKDSLSPSPLLGLQPEPHSKRSPKLVASPEGRRPEPRAQEHSTPEPTCFSCGTTTTPLWRRGPNQERLCNACGIHYKTHQEIKTLSPLARAPKAKPINAEPLEPRSCGSCGTDSTSLWRRGPTGLDLCNACGLYYKNHGKLRGTLDTADANTETHDAQPSGPRSCGSCGTGVTSLWRRGPTSSDLCNACGLYYKTHGKMRGTQAPVSTESQRERNGSDSFVPIKKRKIDESQHEPIFLPAPQANAPTLPTMVKTSTLVPVPAPLSHLSRITEIPATSDTGSSTEVQGLSLQGPIGSCTNCAETQTPRWRKGPNNQTLCDVCGMYYLAHGREWLEAVTSARREQIRLRGSEPRTATTC